MIEMFQDALEDVQYTRGLQSGRLEPSRPLPVIEVPAVEKYINDLRRQDPQALELDRICQQPLGFYLVIFRNCHTSLVVSVHFSYFLYTIQHYF